MKKILLSLTLASSMFAATSCDKVLQKLDEQIVKVQNQKKENPERLDYLKKQKSEISKNCVDGKIDNEKLKTIKANTKYDYESKKLAKKQEKINEKKEKIENKHKQDLEKIKAKKEKEEKKLDKKLNKENAKKEFKEELKKDSNKLEHKANEKISKEEKKAKNKLKKLEEKAAE